MFKLLNLCVVFWAFIINAQAQNDNSSVLKTESIIRGEIIYKKDCRICHKSDGLGKGNKYPPLANSDWLLSNPQKAIRAIKYGLEDQIIVNGVTYAEKMKARSLSDQQIVDVMNYILNSWGNNFEQVISIENID